MRHNSLLVAGWLGPSLLIAIRLSHAAHRQLVAGGGARSSIVFRKVCPEAGKFNDFGSGVSFFPAAVGPSKRKAHPAHPITTSFAINLNKNPLTYSCCGHAVLLWSVFFPPLLPFWGNVLCLLLRAELTRCHVVEFARSGWCVRSGAIKRVPCVKLRPIWRTLQSDQCSVGIFGLELLLGVDKHSCVTVCSMLRCD